METLQCMDLKEGECEYRKTMTKWIAMGATTYHTSDASNEGYDYITEKNLTFSDWPTQMLMAEFFPKILKSRKSV